MKAIWTQDEASYHGEFVSFDASGPGPSPPSVPTRRCWSAATGPTVEDRVLDFGDAWFPNWATTVLERVRRCARGPTGRST